MADTSRFENARKRAAEMLKKMSLTEKIGQLSQFGTSIYSDDHKAFEDHFAEGKIGSYLTIRDRKRINEIQSELVEKSPNHIPALFADDVIHGYKTTFPIPLAQSCTWDPEMTEEGCSIAAKEAYRDGIRWTFAPMVDIARDPRWGRILEGYGEDTYLCRQFSKAAVKGYQGDEIGRKDKLLACMKHFIAYGAVVGGKDYNSVDMSDEQLYDVYLPPFRDGIDAGAATVMTSFNDINGVPATANRKMLTDILRGELGFKGFVVSDDGAVEELINHGYAENEKDAGEKAFNAGLDMLMSGDIFNDNFPELIKEEKISEERINESVLSILTVKYMLGLMDDWHIDEDEDNTFFAPEHLEAAKKNAEHSFVLLENDGILPLKNHKKVALIGPMVRNKRDVMGPWECVGEEERTVTIEDGLKKAYPDTEFLYSMGCDCETDDESGIADAVKTAKDADAVIIAAGLRHGTCGEAASMTKLRLSKPQEILIDEISKTGKPVILLLIGGRPISLSDYKDKVNAMIMLWYPGTETGDAVADVLSGKHNPSGRLTTSFPVTEGQIPVYYNFFSTGRPAVGVQRFEAKYNDCPIEPLYPFGYGKGYSEFSYENISLSADKITEDGTIDVTLTVKNNGKYDGYEVVQLYVRDLVASRVRPVKELKGYKKVFVKAGQSEDIKITLEAKELAFWNSDMKKVVEKGKFKLWTAKNALDNSNEFDFEII